MNNNNPDLYVSFASILTLSQCVFQARCARTFWLPVCSVLVRTEVCVANRRIFLVSLVLVLLDGKVRLSANIFCEFHALYMTLIIITVVSLHRPDV